MSGVLSHTHRYEKTFPNRNKREAVWACNLDGCTHYIPKNLSAEGRKSLCWGGCDTIITLNERTMNDDRPMCKDCKSKQNEVMAALLRMEADEIRAKIAKERGINQSEVTEAEVERELRLAGF